MACNTCLPQDGEQRPEAAAWSPHALFCLRPLPVALPKRDWHCLAYAHKAASCDHFNLHGEGLRSAAALLRPDHASFHVYGKQDAEDESHNFFSNKANRARLERMTDHMGSWVNPSGSDRDGGGTVP